MKLSEEFKLIRWIISSDYIKDLKTTMSQVADPKNEVVGLFEYSKKYYPQMNQEYFPQNFEELKQTAEAALSIRILESSLSENVLGAYYPAKAGKPVIFINDQMPRCFRVSTLGHEMSHVIVAKYLGVDGIEHEPTRVRNRVTVFKEAIADKEELYADILTSFGAYPRHDFQKKFANPKLAFLSKIPFASGIVSFFKAVKHLQKHYPEVAKDFIFSRGALLNVALIIHFFRVRKFVFTQYQV